MLIQDYWLQIRAEYFVISIWVSGVLLQEGRTCVGREDAANEQDIGKLVWVKPLL